VYNSFVKIHVVCVLFQISDTIDIFILFICVFIINKKHNLGTFSDTGKMTQVARRSSLLVREI